MEKKRTIYTIAQEMKLAPGTISKVLNHTGNVSDTTRKRVLSYIKKVGYVPASSARMLKSKRTYTVGIIFTEESNVGLEHSFFSSILQNFKSYVEKEGYELSFIVQKLGQNTMTYLEWCLNKRVDGVYIVVGNYNDVGLFDLVNSGIPCVSTDMFLPGLHTIVSDNDQGIRISLEYVKNELKMKRVAIINGPLSSKAFNERYAAFQKYMPLLGFDIHEDLIAYAESFGFTSGYNAVNNLLKQAIQLPEVILVGSDDIALGVMKGLRDYGLRIPEDVQVLGFDDIAFAKHFTPSLTTISQDRKLLGETAARRLISLIENPDLSFEEVTRLPVELIKRESTRSNQ